MKSLSRHCNRRLLSSLLVLALFTGCSNLATRNDRQQSDSSSANLPHNYVQGLSHMANDDFATAIPILQRFSAEHPDLAGPWLNLGIALHNSGRSEEAVQALQRATELNPKNPAAWQQLGIAQRTMGQFTTAQKAYTRALELDPGYALAHRNLGILYDIYLQEPALALEQYRLYLEFSEQPDTNVHRWIADLERRSNQAQAGAAP